ncbi:MAG: hypothetical protein ABIL22_04995 [candidate division WOR-3 bacterium]
MIESVRKSVNAKFQNPNIKQISIVKFQIKNLVIVVWKLFGVWDLVLGI